MKGEKGRTEDVQRFRGGLVFKADRLCVSLNSRLESNNEEEEEGWGTHMDMLCCAVLCYAMLCYVILCYAMLCYSMLCYATLCYAILCYAMLCYAVEGREGAHRR